MEVDKPEEIIDEPTTSTPMEEDAPMEVMNQDVDDQPELTNDDDTEIDIEEFLDFSNYLSRRVVAPMDRVLEIVEMKYGYGENGEMLTVRCEYIPDDPKPERSTDI